MGRRIKPFSAEMTLIDAAAEGWAIAKHEGRVIFVEEGVPGDKAVIHVFRKHKKQLFGRIESLIQPSPERIPAACQHFSVCGGCKWQMMSYQHQLTFKQKSVEDAFARIAKTKPQEIKPILASESEYFYRNKLEFTFSSKAWLTKDQIDRGEMIDQRVLGFHVPRIFDKIINIDNCLLQKPIINDIRNEIRDFARQQEWPFYDIRANEGLLRNVIFRTTEHKDQLMLVIILAEDRPEVIDHLCTHLEGRFPQITHFLWIHNPKLNSSYSELPFQLWKGSEYVLERLGQFDFRISPTSFFQTNPTQALQLYGLVKSMLAEILPEGQRQHETIYDLYAGTGSIGIFISDLAKKVVGIEYVESSIADAWKNVALNQLSHFAFYAGDMKKVLTPELVEKEGVPSVMIVDPPRAGMDPKVVQRILQIAPEYIIYVSCKPATQARDVALLHEKYELLRIQAVDMFPQTAHVENVALLGLSVLTS